MLTTSNQLNEQQLNHLQSLVDACKKADGSAPNVYPYLLEQLRALPANVLYYEKEKMIGFLSVYFFYEDAVEVAILVHPDFRRKGIAKQLLTTIKPLLEVNHIEKLIFTNPAQKNSTWLETQGFSYQHSEYHMLRNDLNPILESRADLSFRTAQELDIPELCALDEGCFPRKQSELPERFHNLLNDRNYKIILAEINGKIIGKAHLRWEDNGATLSDIAISPQNQGKGYGSALIAQCINLALSDGKPEISLDVETHNTKALDLYKKLGFYTENACDYWKIPFGHLVHARQNDLRTQG